MPVPAWIDRLASDLLDIEAELRPLLRDLSRHHDADTMGPPKGTTEAGRYGRTVTISANQARTLLRAAMPLPIGSTRLRQPHGRMLAALQLFAGHLLSLNDPITAPDHAAAAGAALLTELRKWIAAARWHQACRSASIRWPADAGAIMPLTQQQTAAKGERLVNAEDLPGLTVADMAAQAPEDGTQALRRRRRRAAAAAQATQDALESAATATTAPTVIPLRPAPAPAQATPAPRHRTA